jgi:hypothetical protein
MHPRGHAYPRLKTTFLTSRLHWHSGCCECLAPNGKMADECKRSGRYHQSPYEGTVRALCGTDGEETGDHVRQQCPCSLLRPGKLHSDASLGRYD